MGAAKAGLHTYNITTGQYQQQFGWDTGVLVSTSRL
jgi:hypothetical protein